MRKRGYSGGFAAGIIAAGGTLGILLPPSITMILFSVMTNASVGKLFIAGFVPGIVVGICIAVYCVWYALKHRIVSGREWDRAEIARTTREVIWTLGAPVLIFAIHFDISREMVAPPKPITAENSSRLPRLSPLAVR